MANLVPEEVQPREDEMSQTIAHMVVGLTFHRLKRCAFWLLGWSSRSCYFTRNDDKAGKEINSGHLFRTYVEKGSKT